MIYSPKYNLWWPEFETDHEDVEAYIASRVTDADVVAGHVRTKGMCIQAGGHVGMFPRQLAKHFAFVFTFEPIPDMHACLKRNVESYQHIIATNAALGPEMGRLRMATRRSGRSRATDDGDITVEQITIDRIHLPRCDLIYLDIEGFELPALVGAKETIKKFRPVIAVEVLKGEAPKVQAWATANNYTVAQRIHSDWILTP
jgi:FkbM family methyltransferase